MFLSFSDVGQGHIHATGAIVSNGTFGIDGEEYPSEDGWLASWTAVDSRTWRTAYKVNGAVTTIDQLALSPDDNTLTIERTQGVGHSERHEMFVLTRTSGKGTLIGRWEMKRANVGDSFLDLLPYGEGGVSINWATATCNAKFDGNEYPLVGPSIPAGVTLALTQTGPRSFDMTQKQNGKPISERPTSYTVSVDGKTLTAGRLVYDRQ